MRPIMGHYDTGSAIEAEPKPGRIERVRMVTRLCLLGRHKTSRRVLCAHWQFDTPKCMKFPGKVSKLERTSRVSFKT